MLKHFFTAILTSAVLMLPGCMATGPAFQEATAPSTGESLVYVYRPAGLVLAVYDANFFVDGKELVHLANNGYTKTYLSAGRHLIMQRWFDSMVSAALLGLTARKIELAVDAKAGGTQYFRFSTGTGNPGYGITLAWRLEQVSPEIGAAEIAKMKYQPAKI